ncbi:MAG: aspartyl/glutamyl-tRNA amidotransferase subunit C [Candidatus Pacebacteria bacterium]|nr:aspartyl/glutamyl-tRNA amidotransferase subunit C [Candidatus Paceibacterota bacterium]
MSDKTIDINALATLARLEIPESDITALQGEISSIVGFVDAIQAVVATIPEPAAGAHRNVLRADENPHESGIYTNDLLAAAPDHTATHVRVKQVISGGKYAE